MKGGDLSESCDDDDIPQLSEHAAKALQEFLAGESLKQNLPNYCDDKMNSALEFQENWQLSQFWYTRKTADILAQECLAASNIGSNCGRIACISCPSVYKSLLQLAPDLSDQGKVILFEFDKEFARLCGDNFVYFDFNFPLVLDHELKESFDIVIADPPYLSEDCLCKFSQTIRFLTKGKVLLCTGAIMSELAQKLLGVRELSFEPEHANNLANQFKCFSNYDCSVLT